MVDATTTLRKAVTDPTYRNMAYQAYNHLSKNAKRAIGLSFAPSVWDNLDDKIRGVQQEASDNTPPSPSKQFYTPQQFSEDYSTVNLQTSLYDNPNIGFQQAVSKLHRNGGRLVIKYSPYN